MLSSYQMSSVKLDKESYLFSALVAGLPTFFFRKFFYKYSSITLAKIVNNVSVGKKLHHIAYIYYMKFGDSGALTTKL